MNMEKVLKLVQCSRIYFVAHVHAPQTPKLYRSTEAARFHLEGGVLALGGKASSYSSTKENESFTSIITVQV
jgi:2-iminoacetate synthase ThiH